MRVGSPVRAWASTGRNSAGSTSTYDDQSSMPTQLNAAATNSSTEWLSPVATT